MGKHQLSERDICTKFITPALEKAGWDISTQIREEYPLTKGRIIVRGKLTTRARNKRADYVLFLKPNLPIAVIEAKDNTHTVGDGMQQALGYAELLDVPFAFSTNGDRFLFHNKLAADGTIEREISLDEFPSTEALWKSWAERKGLTSKQSELVTQDYYSDGTDKTPRYYQVLAINKTVEAVAKGENRILLVMATGTGKTYTAFQIIWRLWKSRAKKRILFLADRNILVDQTMTNDFKPFGSAMTKIQKRQANKSYEIYLSLYQAVSGVEEERNIYKQFSRDFFDLIVVDECHRGSAAADSAWREILDYFTSATQIGLTATPKETRDVCLLQELRNLPGNQLCPLLQNEIAVKVSEVVNPILDFDTVLIDHAEIWSPTGEVLIQIDAHNLVRGEEAIIDALTQGVGIDRLAEIVDVGTHPGRLRFEDVAISSWQILRHEASSQSKYLA